MKTFSLQDMERCFNDSRLVNHNTPPFVHSYFQFKDFMAAVHPPQPDDRVPGVRADDVLVCIRDIEGTYKNEELTVIRLMDDYSAFIRSAKSQLWVSLIPSHPNTSYPYVWNYFHLKQPDPQPELKAWDAVKAEDTEPAYQPAWGEEVLVVEMPFDDDGKKAKYLCKDPHDKDHHLVVFMENGNFRSVFIEHICKPRLRVTHKQVAELMGKELNEIEIVPE